MNAHTPGPWHVIPAYASAGAGVQTNDGYIIADLPDNEDFNVQANAALIAGAPDLKLACIYAETGIREMLAGASVDLIDVLNHLTAAIARAEGN